MPTTQDRETYQVFMNFIQNSRFIIDGKFNLVINYINDRAMQF